MGGRDSQLGRTPLREQRNRAGLTQRELAELSGVSRWTIIDIERGRVRSPRVFTIVALAFALDVDPAILVPRPREEAT